MNCAKFCLEKRTLAYVLAAALFCAGAVSYFHLGRLEDPEFTLRLAQVVTAYPGASAADVAEQVSDRIETAVQRLGCVKHVTSTSLPGKSIVAVEIRPDCPGRELPRVWSQLRARVTDAIGELPPGCGTPYVQDDYSDVYGVFYAVSGEGLTTLQLKDYAKTLKRELLACQDVAKVDLFGVPPEAIYLDVSATKLAATGLTPERVRAALAGFGLPEDAGAYRAGDKRIRLSPTGEATTLETIGDVLLASDVRLRDVATLTRAPLEPVSCIMRYNGRTAIGVGISTVKGGNVVAMGQAVDAGLKRLLPVTPLGIEVHTISHQGHTVEESVAGFFVNLLESVALVLLVLLVSMGLRPGLLVGSILILTVFGTFFLMDVFGVMFERISFGAFIIALGMLVDNAIVIVEAIYIAARTGKSRKEAAILIVQQTQKALLGGTVIAVLSFAPIGASQNASGEYCRSLFQVVGCSMLLSWVLAITITPLVASRFLKKVTVNATQTTPDPYAGWFFRAYRRILVCSLNHRYFTLLVLGCLLVSSVAGFRFVRQNFFPESTRTQFMVHVRLPEGTSVHKTDACMQSLAAFTAQLPGVTGVSSVTGSGTLRFLLTYSPEEPNAAYGVLFVDVACLDQIAPLQSRIEAEAPSLVPDAKVYCQRFANAAFNAPKIQVRIVGREGATLRKIGEEVTALLRADGHVRDIENDWQTPVDLIEPVYSAARASRLGVSRSVLARALRTATDGLPVGQLVEGDETLPILLRSPSDLSAAWVWPQDTGAVVPVAQLVDGYTHTTEESRIKRRDRRFCLTINCNPSNAETSFAAFQRVLPQLETLKDKLPVGYTMEWGGEYEGAQEANATLTPSFGPILATMALIVLALFNSIRKTLTVVLTVPLILIGVTAGLLLFDKPFGFMALLGFLALVGMQIKNAIVLVDEIGMNITRGLKPGEAVVEAGISRVRPVANAAVTTILGMLPLITDAFFAAMAVTIMAGLAFATVLTMLVVPVLYVTLYRIRLSDNRSTGDMQ